jgi:hypothetical protein
MHILGTLSGAAVQNVELTIARYCVQLKELSGSINIEYVVTDINNKYKLVAPNQLSILVNDIAHAFQFIENQKIEEISRAGYWKFKAKTKIEAIFELETSFVNLGIPTKG